MVACEGLSPNRAQTRRVSLPLTLFNASVVCSEAPAKPWGLQAVCRRQFSQLKRLQPPSSGRLQAAAAVKEEGAIPRSVSYEITKSSHMTASTGLSFHLIPIGMLGKDDSTCDHEPLHSSPRLMFTDFHFLGLLSFSTFKSLLICQPVTSSSQPRHSGSHEPLNFEDTRRD